MKTFLDSTSAMRELSEYIDVNIDQLIHADSSFRKKTTVASEDILTDDQKSHRKTIAAKIIQRIYRGHKIKEKIATSPYFSYLSMLDKNSDEYLLSMLMFGQHQAEFRTTSKERILNPFTRRQPIYHRDDQHAGPLLDRLLLDFGVSATQRTYCNYIPLMQSHNTPITDYLESDRVKERYPGLRLIQDEHHSISLLEIPSGINYGVLRFEISAYGYVATPWAIAENIKHTPSDVSIPKDSVIVLDPALPNTKELLLSSQMMQKLALVAGSNSHPTRRLAQCLKDLLEHMPELSPAAIQRIALMLDITHTFYSHHYTRYASCVYMIVHELSLAIGKESGEALLSSQYADFQAESKRTLCHSLSLSEKQEQAYFFSSPAISGTNAYAIAVKLAKQMATTASGPPTIRVFKPSYYEFDGITQSVDDGDADIFAISTGPIMNPDGISPGLDINLFLKRHMLDKGRTKPITLIIDATTTLYRHLELNAEVRALIDAGKLSIIIHESHQKFGLIHTDQAQYGRVFGICSSESYQESVIRQIEAYGEADFRTHRDMRIGAFMSVTCGNMLEEIKQQHFRNGALLRNLLMKVSLVSKEVVSHEDMLTDLNELYFLGAPGCDSSLFRAAGPLMDFRASFGHYSTIMARVRDITRISPDASDDLDCLVLTAQIFLASIYTPLQIMDLMIRHAHDQEELSLKHQIVLLAMLKNIMSLYPLSDKKSEIMLLNLYISMSKAIDSCSLLRGRTGFSEVQRFLLESRATLTASSHPENNHKFMKAMWVIYDKDVELSRALVDFVLKTTGLIHHIISNPDACSYLNFLERMNEKIPEEAQRLFENLYPDRATRFMAITKQEEDQESLLALIDRDRESPHLLIQLRQSMLEHEAKNPALLSSILRLSTPEECATQDARGRTILHRVIDTPDALYLILNAIPVEQRKHLLSQQTTEGQTVLHQLIKKPNVLLAILAQVPIAEQAFLIQQKDAQGRSLLFLSNNDPGLFLSLVSFLPERGRFNALHDPDIYQHALLDPIYKSPERLNTLLHLLPICDRKNLVRPLVQELFTGTANRKCIKKLQALVTCLEREGLSSLLRQQLHLIARNEVIPRACLGSLFKRQPQTIAAGEHQDEIRELFKIMSTSDFMKRPESLNAMKEVLKTIAHDMPDDLSHRY